MQANYVQRLRLTFRKVEMTRYIGHLDLARTLERALNRAKIPMAYTQGFNRRPRMQFASALSLGTTSDGEMADIWLQEAMEPEAARVQIMSRMAPGIEVVGIADVPLRAPAMQTLTRSAHYVVTLLDAVDMEALQDRIEALLATETLVRERGKGRKRKEYDLRPFILALTLSQSDEGLAQIVMHLTLEPSKTGRPDEVLLALELEPLDARIHRTQIVLDE